MARPELKPCLPWGSRQTTMAGCLVGTPVPVRGRRVVRSRLQSVRAECYVPFGATEEDGVREADGSVCTDESLAACWRAWIRRSARAMNRRDRDEDCCAAERVAAIRLAACWRA